MSEKTLSVRMRNFVLVGGAFFIFLFLFLPGLTNSIGPVRRMADMIDEKGIDPSRYYYTDVPQVAEAEAYLREALHRDSGAKK